MADLRAARLEAKKLAMKPLIHDAWVHGSDKEESFDANSGWSNGLVRRAVASHNEWPIDASIAIRLTEHTWSKQLLYPINLGYNAAGQADKL